MSNKQKNTMLVEDIENYDVDNMIFSKVIETKGKAGGKRIYITTKNPDGSTGDLILPTCELFSFGVSEQTDFNDPTKINGYTLPLCLLNKDGPSDEETAWLATYNRIVNHIKDWMVENKEDIFMPDLEKRDMKDMCPLYWKKDKTTKKILDGATPILYAKLIQKREKSSKDDKEEDKDKEEDTNKPEKFITLFFDEDGNELSPMEIMKKYCYTTAAIKVESIFLGTKIKLQLKLREATIRLVNSGSTGRLLAKPKNKGTLLPSTPVENKEEDNDKKVERTSSSGSLDEEDETTSPLLKTPAPVPKSLRVPVVTNSVPTPVSEQPSTKPVITVKKPTLRTVVKVNRPQ